MVVVTLHIQGKVYLKGNQLLDYTKTNLTFFGSFAQLLLVKNSII
jgi:hypothetical protein